MPGNGEAKSWAVRRQVTLYRASPSLAAKNIINLISVLTILKEISPGISLEGMMLKLKLQYFGHLMQRVDSLEKTLML